jgi:hypothetical protein
MTVELRARVLDNPFYVLELAPECSRAEVERAGQKLLAMLELSMAGAERYPTPFGPGRRDPAKVREAMAELRDPQRRLFHELWVRGTTQVDLASSSRLPAEWIDEDPPGFEQAPTSLGWRR